MIRAESPPQTRLAQWSSALPAVFATALGTCILAGALVTGDSLRGSVQDVRSTRSSRTSYVLGAPGYFSADLAREMARAGPWSACAMITLDGAASVPSTHTRLPSVKVYGIDGRFWAFHGKAPRTMRPTEALLSEALARDLKADRGSQLLLRLDRPSPVPSETLFGSKKEQSVFLHVTVLDILARADLGGFSISEGQDGGAVFLPLSELQRELTQPGRVNTILLSARPGKRESAALAEALRERLTPEDAGLRFSELEDGGALVESDATLISDPLVAQIGEAAQRLGTPLSGVSSYLATAIRAGERSVPYSFVAAVDPSLMSIDQDAIVLNAWTARDLHVRAGDSVRLEYSTWENGGWSPKMASFRIQQVVPMADLGADPALVPAYDGIAGSKSIRDWAFPVDPHILRPQDEEYWRSYGRAPKALLNLATGQKLWSTRFGSVTSLRVRLRSPAMDGEDGLASFRIAVQKQSDPVRLGFRIQDFSAPASRDDDFTSRLLACSILPVAGSFLLSTRFRRTGTWSVPVAGAVLGAAAGCLYAAFLIYALVTYWHGIGPSTIRLHVQPLTVLWGGLAGLGLASFCISLARRSGSGAKWVCFVFAGIAVVAVLTAEVVRRPGTPVANFNIVAQSRAPLIVKPAAPAGVRYFTFRLRPGENGSATVLGAPPGFRGGKTGSFHNEIVTTEADFLQAFPKLEGYRFFLASASDPQSAIPEMNAAYAAYGLNAELASARFARVREGEENWFFIFETLGALGVLLALTAFFVRSTRTIALRGDK